MVIARRDRSMVPTRCGIRRMDCAVRTANRRTECTLRDVLWGCMADRKVGACKRCGFLVVLRGRRTYVCNGCGYKEDAGSVPKWVKKDWLQKRKGDK